MQQHKPVIRTSVVTKKADFTVLWYTIHIAQQTYIGLACSQMFCGLLNLNYKDRHDLHSVQMFYSGVANDFITSFPNTPKCVADKIRSAGPF